MDTPPNSYVTYYAANYMSYPNLAKELGRKDHTTAMHSVDKIEKYKSSTSWFVSK